MSKAICNFPSISTEAYGYPIEKAVHVAFNTVHEFIKENCKNNNLIMERRMSYFCVYFITKGI
jgi:O-acetyl-ADP-ribose deacetylase (regulator of RNase III)